MAAELTDEQIISTALSMGMWGVQGVRPSGETFITGMGDGVIKTVRSLLATQGAEPVGGVIGYVPLSAVEKSPLAGYVPVYTAPPPTAEVEKDAALRLARAHIKWLAFGECRADGWEGAPPTALQAVDAINAALQSDQAQAGKGE